MTDKYQPDMYGAGVINTGYMYFFFSERFRAEGGKFFDPATMKATVNSDAGVKALTDMVEQNKCMSPGIETWGFVENFSALTAGQIAMTISWPPVGRWAQGVNVDDAALAWVPKTTVTDKIGYAINPGGHPELASGFISGVSVDSKNKDAAYLYIQWMHSKDQSLKNVMRPVGLRDPFRLSHYASPDYSRGTRPPRPSRTHSAADLLVVGARRPKGQFGIQLGHVVHRVLHHALCPVAVVPQAPTDHHDEDHPERKGRKRNALRKGVV